MRKVFTILMVCITIMGLKAQNVPNPFPFQFSTNTGTGAVWYIIQQDKNASAGIRPWIPNGLAVPISMRWSTPNPANEDEQFCFVGDNTNGFYIYNKAYLAGKTVGGVTLVNDLKLQNLGVYDPANMWGGTAKLGFTTSTSITGSDLINKFILVEGNGTTHDGVARVGHYKICSATGSGTPLALRLNGSSQGELISVDWGDIYFNTFLYVSGTLTAVSQTTKANVAVYAKNGSIYVNGAKGVLSITYLDGKSKKIIASGGITTIPVNATGVYVISIDGISYKVIVK